MAFIDNYELENLKNEAERLVFEELGKQLEQFEEGDVCMCNECVIDMAALALNSVKPLYRHSLLGTLYAAEITHDNEQYAEDLRLAVMNSIKHIRKNPSHA